jgi:hypothetical protein
MADKIYNESMCADAERLMASGKSIARLATHFGVCRDTIYEWCKKHPEFAKSFKNGKDSAQAYWEELGEEGISGNLDKFSATAWIFTMKNRFRDDYKEDKKEEKTINETLLEKIIDKLVE